MKRRRSGPREERPEAVFQDWRRRPDLNRGWSFCRALPYHLATAPIDSAWEDAICLRCCSLLSTRAERSLRSEARQAGCRGPRRFNIGAGNGIRTRDFDLGKVALYH